MARVCVVGAGADMEGILNWHHLLGGLELSHAPRIDFNRAVL